MLNRNENEGERGEETNREREREMERKRERKKLLDWKLFHRESSHKNVSKNNLGQGLFFAKEPKLHGLDILRKYLFFYYEK